MRDRLMNEQYFKDYIADDEERIRKFETKLSNGEVREDRSFAVKSKIDAIKFGLFMAKYSIGDDIGDLKLHIDSLIKDMPKFWNEDSSYVDMVWMMSIGIMMEVEINSFEVFVYLVEKYDRHDALLDFFIDYKMNNIIELKNKKFIFGEPYNKLGKIIENDSNREFLLENYLRKFWYKGHKEMAWYDIHKSKEKLYNGYWSFESGAVAKILEINDSSLKECPYYPYDLVHYHY